MPQVRVPDSYFRSKLRDYADWRAAFARELLQNSVDARATRITVIIDVNDAGNVVVTVDDDGHGMTYHTLDKVFFTVGETTKHGAGTVGGFGQARLITCFGQHSYRIDTLEWVATGAGAQYDITRADTVTGGCRVTVETIDVEPQPLIDAFERLLRRSHVAAVVTVNGREVPGTGLPSRARRVLKDDDGKPWAKVYVVRDVGWGLLYVRSSGLTMFTRFLSATDDHVIVELEPSRSRETLVHSRDRLVSPFAEQIDRFVHDLATNRRRALRPAAQPLDVQVAGGGFLVSAAQPAETENGACDERGPTARRDLDRSPVNGHSSGDGRQSGTPVRPVDAAAAAALQTLARPMTVTARRERESDLPVDVFMFADEQTARTRKLARVWNPSGWDATTGRQRRALLLAWQAAVQSAIDALHRAYPSRGPLSWAIGWTFDTETEAMAVTRGGGTIFALNPVDDEDRIRYRQLRSSATKRQLAARALHEVAHVVTDAHDETYASVLTELFAEFNERDAYRMMEDARASA